MTARLLVWFKDVGKDDVALVGGKGANLGEMTRAGFPVPPGFIITSHAYYEFLKINNLEEKIQEVLKDVDYEKSASVAKASKTIKTLITNATIPSTLTHEIFKAYKKLSGIFTDALVAVRSSATAEDLPNASFAGQQETYLNIKGEANLLLKIKDAWASLFDARAMFYRHENKFDHKKIGIAVPVQKMIESETSGVMFSIDPLTNNKQVIVIEAIYGLGELIVQGTATPDHYEVDKNSLKITTKTIQVQKNQLIQQGHTTKIVPISGHKGKEQKISDQHIVKLATLVRQLEKHYYYPQDSEWAIEKGKIYLVQTRPITTIHEKEQKKETTLVETLPLLVKGDPASPGLATGPVKILQSAKEINKIHPGDILVAPHTNPDYVSAMKKAVAIVTDTGGRTSHAAIVAREIGIPAVVGTLEATKKLRDEMIVTVNGSKGEIYKGGHLGKQAVQIHTTHTKTATKIYVNLGEKEFAENIAKRNVDGVGLLRAEFMMASIGKHPKKLIQEGKKSKFVDMLADDLTTFAQAFDPRPVVYRASDFKTNEYRNLIGGKEYEPLEPNPMLGYRGGYRYIHDQEVFELELEAIKKVRNKFGHKNLWLMLPFIRTVKELTEIKQIISAAGLHRSPTFKLWMMVEIPSNVILLDKFIDVGIDGVSIGSNDLTMLMMGTDRDNQSVATEFNEQDEAMLWAYERVIKTAHKYGITSSICGQIASQAPALLEKLVTWGISSVSVFPDAIDTTREHVAAIEKKLIS